MRRLGFVLLLLAGCSTKPAHKAVVVTIHAMSFDPPSVTLERGDTVVFDNQDIVAHTATDKGVFDSGPLEPKQLWRKALEKPGEYPYGCTLHPNMTGTLTVR